MEESINTPVKMDQPKKGKPSTQTDVSGEKLLRRYVGALNAHDLKKAVSFFAEDFVIEEGSRRKHYSGKEHIRDSVRALFREFPDFKMEINSIFGGGPAWSLVWSWTGTFANKKNPDGNYEYIEMRVKQRGQSIFWLKDGKFSREARIEDMNSFGNWLQFAIQDYYLKPRWIEYLETVKSGWEERLRIWAIEEQS